MTSPSTVFSFNFKFIARGRSRQTKRLLTAVCLNAGFIGKIKFPHLIIFVPADSRVLRNPALRQAAERYMQA
jgi:hypothetical protein